METRLTYTPTTCFETFPFPDSLAGLDAIGQRYYEHRQLIMQTRQEGLTKTYNRFHDPAETAADIGDLRRLHVEMDQAVAAAYGWQGITLGHALHETNQGLRYTLAEPARREVLDRLLALNYKRYAEEVAAGLHETRPPRRTVIRVRRAPSGATLQGELFAVMPPSSLLDNPPPTRTNEPEAILAYLRAHPGLHSKEAILSATGVPADRWTATINTLLTAAQVERQGERRGAKYRFRGPTLD